MGYQEEVIDVSRNLKIAHREKVKTGPCYRSAIAVSEVLTDAGHDSRVVYAGGHSFSLVRIAERMYFASAYGSERLIIRTPFRNWAIDSFERSGHVGFVTDTPGRRTIAALDRIGSSQLTTDSPAQFAHTMTLDEARRVFGSFERANSYRGCDDAQYCRTVVDELDGKYAPLYSVAGAGISSAAIGSIAMTLKLDQPLAEAAISAIAHTSTRPGETVDWVTRTVAAHNVQQ